MTQDAPALAGRLSRMVRVATVTPPTLDPLSPEEAATFVAFQALLRELYPTLFSVAEIATVGRAGLLLRVGGTGKATGSPELGPLLLLAHQDVVPAPRADWESAGWTHPPFAGTVDDGEDGLTVHGRGTLDDKGALLVMLEAVEDLLEEGWRPQHDVRLLLGADEENLGASAVAAAVQLENEGARPALVVDEGGAVVTGIVPGLTRNVAVVGVAEKGLTTLEVAVSADPRKPAHASTPPRRSAAGGLARAILALERHPHPARLDDVALRMFTGLAPHVPGLLGRALARADRLQPFLGRILPLAGPELAAMVRTTMEVTMLEGSAAPNVLGARARALVNMRVETSSSVAEATAHVERVVRRAVGRGLTVDVSVLEGSEPTPPSPMDERWDAVRTAIAAAYPDAVAVPYTMLAASDSRHLAHVAPAIYRFSPLYMSATQRASVHGVDERVTADSLLRGVRFYRALLCPSEG
ncbi:MAG TPA: M20/M25/M40 family metallo-hydrolase [Propionibacteriaceae bacterium]|nr:M20/M25/M40 family metallo-hydrolase [Propionibacteriaceae bacterium]